MRRCTKCILPETFAGIEFDENGICNVCQSREERRKIDWQTREEEFKAILEECKSRAIRTNAPYDIVVPFSGGKDSTYTLYTMVKEYGMKPLVVSFNHCFFTEVIKENQEKTLRALAVDHIMFTPNWEIVKKLCAKSFRLTGDFCWHCHCGVYAFPMQIAAKYKIPSVIWGSTDYTLEDNIPIDRKRFETDISLGVKPEDMVQDGITLNDLRPWVYPVDEELEGVISINHGAYEFWDVRKQLGIIKKELGWRGSIVEGSYANHDKVECKYIGVRDYIKFIRRGYGRSAQLASVDIRDGLMTREGALKVIEEYDGKRPSSLTEFLKDTGMIEEEFMWIAEKHKVY